MQFNDAEYKKLLDKFVKEEYEKANPKPSGMFGNWSYRIKKEREFKEIMIKTGRILTEKK